MKPKLALSVFLLLSIVSASVPLCGQIATESAPIFNLVYTSLAGVNQTLDLYFPPSGLGPFPAVLVIHGGGWYSGDKSEWAFEAISLAQAGYTAVAINYRLAPTYPWPAQLQDCQAAVLWLRANAATYHIDPNRIGAFGGSAGGHLAQMLGVSGSGPLNVAARVSAVVSWSGPSDLVLMAASGDPNLTGMVSTLFGGSPTPALEADASPTSWLDSTDAPVYHANSTAELIPINQADTLRAALRAAGVAQGEDTINGTGHARDYENAVWGATLAWFGKYLADTSMRFVLPSVTWVSWEDTGNGNCTVRVKTGGADDAFADLDVAGDLCPVLSVSRAWPFRVEGILIPTFTSQGYLSRHMVSSITP